MRVSCVLQKLIVLIGLIGCQSCSPVAPWERGNLAKRDMALDPSPNLSHIREHIYTSREASQGGKAGSGGGCGCN
jgi:hypothetical protein